MGGVTGAARGNERGGVRVGGSGGGEVDEDVLWARALLSRIAEPASVPLWMAVREEGPVAVAQAIVGGRAGSGVSVVAAARAAGADPWLDLEAASRHGIRLVVPESAEWPHFAFAALEAAGERRARRWRAGDRKQSESGEPVPPLALWIRGNLDLATAGVRSVAVVGSRSASPYGVEIARSWGEAFAEQEVTVVSGGAYGIDAAAHRAALDAGGDSILVSAGGLDAPYPPSNAGLYDRVAAAGLCVSESPPGCAPRRRRFLTRNRLIAAFGSGTVVVEAARRSGALNTAHHAAELGRPLLAVPGSVHSAQSAGCHGLIARDVGAARLVASANDVLDALGFSRDVLAEPDPERRDGFGLSERLDALDDTARQVFDGFPARAWTDPDRLALATGLPALTVLRTLPSLELAGVVESSVSGFRIASKFWRAGPGSRRSSPSVPTTP
jgi:DNA processing protein